MKNLTRSSVLSAVAAALTLVLAACSGGGTVSGPATGKAQDAGGDLARLVSINAKDVKDLQPGGTVTLPLGSIGPDFNTFSRSGNSGDSVALQSPMNQAGCWSYDFDGAATPDKNFCEDIRSDVKDGKQTVTIKINDKAAYNDGTPIDAKTFENTWQMLRGANKDINIVTSGAYEFVDSVRAGANDKEVIVTTTQPVFPLDSLFGGLVHPKVNTPEIFNNGFAGNLHPEWMAGPFKLDQYDSAARTVILVPNEKWWGTKPLLDRVVFRQMESSAAIAAFKNGEIDAVSANTVTRYKQLEGTKDAEVRRGQRLFAGGLNLNAQKAPLTEVAIRKAIFTAVDREALRKIQFNGLNWEEGNPGSMMLMPFSKYYQDNYPVTETGPDAAKKVLADAGYTPNAAGVMEKDGVPAKFTVSNFGDDPTGLAFAQTLQKQLQAGGMDVGIDQRASGDFGSTMASGDYFLSLSGFSVGPDATEAVKQFYDSTTNHNQVGDAELDAEIRKVSTIADPAERNKAAMEIEKKHMAKYFSMGVVLNGPQISFVRTGLANYGPSLFKGVSQVPDWTSLGWEKK